MYRKPFTILIEIFIIFLLLTPVLGEQIPNVDRVVVYKKKRVLQLCRGDSVLKQYPIALGKTPEGRYILDWRNPNSKYYLSIHISYPNKADKQRADSLGVNPGGAIMVHGYPTGRTASLWNRYWFLGRDWTDGCIAVSNEAMDEIWASVKDGTPIDIHP